ncbi:hypothetical protein ABBQ32_005008 [Trebouxia sp. C0010 RCD-2024]
MSLEVELDVLLRSGGFVPTLSLVSVVLVALSAIVLLLRYRKASDSSALAVGKDIQQNGVVEELEATGPRVTLLYGTQTGTAERFAKQLKNEMSSRYGDSNHYSIVDIEDYKAEEVLCNEKLVFFLMATYGDGEPTDNAADFYNWLIKAGKEAEDGGGESLLKGVSYGVFGLGNKQYEHFCAVGHKVHAAMEQLGAQPVVRRGDGDDDVDIDADFEGWRTELYTSLDGSSLLDKREGSSTQTTTAVLTEGAVPAYTVQVLSGSQAQEVEPLSASSDSSGSSASHPYSARITVLRELHTRKSDRSCLHVELDIQGSGLQYEAGDHVGLYGENSPDIVAQAGRILDLPLDTVFTLQLPEGNPDELAPPFPGPVSLRTALAKYADLWAPAHKACFTALAASASSESEAARLRHLASSEGKAEFSEWVGAPRRSLLEVLQAFPSVKPSIGAFFGSMVPRLQPRFYSISSSPKQCPDSIHVTCAVVVDTTATGRQHEGVCSNYLKRQSVGERIPIFVRHSHFKLPKQVSTPVVMVGPGTGLAPFRGFLQERAALQKAGVDLGPAYLFFGCRKKSQDYIYEQELSMYARNGVLQKLFVAFSRDAASKVYVQQQMQAQAAEVAKLLSDQEGGHVYVCGDAKRMAKDVHAALLEILQTQSSMSSKDAEQRLKELTSNNRYQRDVW